MIAFFAGRGLCSDSMGLFSALRARRRRRILERSPIGEELWEWAIGEHRIFRGLPPAAGARLRELSTVFLGEKEFHPVGGAILDEELRVSVAAQACLPLLGLDLDWYRDFSTIYITPREYDVRKMDVDEAGVVHEYDDEFAGEAFDLGPVALSRVDIEASGWGDGYNVVIHEMAHKLDGRDGSFDGCPPLHRDMDSRTWKAAFSAAYGDFRERLAAPKRRKPRHGKLRRADGPRLDSYAAEGPDEFFAVSCEYFFERPLVLRGEYPAVYAELVKFFRQDPSSRSNG